MLVATDFEGTKSIPNDADTTDASSFIFAGDSSNEIWTSAWTSTSTTKCNGSSATAMSCTVPAADGGQGKDFCLMGASGELE
jgi:hypothetical protein